MKTKNQIKTVPNQFSFNGKLVKTGSYYLAFVILGMCVAILGPTLPDLARNTHTSISSLSILFTARSLGYLIGAYSGGRLFDRIKGHPLMAVMLILSAASIALIPAMNLMVLLVLAILLLGISESIIDVGGNTLLVWIHRGKTGTYMNGLHFFFGIGGFIAPILLAQVIILTNDFSWAYWFLALMILPVALLIFIIPSPQIRKTTSDDSEDRINRPLIAGLILFFFLWVGAEGGFGGWIFTYALKSGLTDKTGAAYLTSAFWGAFTMARLFSIPLAIRLKPIYLLVGSLSGVLISLGILIQFSASFNALLIGTIGIGMFMASVFPTTLAFSERRMVLSGKITGWFFIGAGVGGMSLPWIMGQFIESNPVYFLFILMAITAAAFVTLLWLTKITRGT